MTANRPRLSVISMTARASGKAPGAHQPLEALAEALLGRFRRPGAEIVVLERVRELRFQAEELARLVRIEAGKPRRFQIGGAAVGGLDQCLQVLGQFHRQAEAQMYGGE